MIAFKYLVVLMCLTNCALGLGLCGLNLDECTTKIAQHIFKALVTGVKGLVESVEPLHLPAIDAERDNFSFHLKNMTMNGLSNCTVELFKTEKLSLDFELKISCPKVFINYDYNVKGYVLPDVYCEGTGFATLTADDYGIIIKGKFREIFSLADPRVRMSITNNFIDSDLKGRLKLEIDGLIHPDKAQSDLNLATMNEHFKEVEQLYFKSPIVENFMTLFIKRFDTYLKNFPLEDILKNAEADLNLAIANEHFKEIEQHYVRSSILEKFITLFVKRFNTYLKNFPLEEILKNAESKLPLPLPKLGLL